MADSELIMVMSVTSRTESHHLNIGLQERSKTLDQANNERRQALSVAVVVQNQTGVKRLEFPL